MNSIYVAWQNEQTREWWPVGQLCYDKKEELYLFVYTKGAEASRFKFVEMNDYGTVYKSRQLFPFLTNRLLSKNRPEYEQFLRWLNYGNEGESEVNSLEILALTEGKRNTDAITVFPCPTPSVNNTFEVTFFVHGISHMLPEAIERIKEIQNGQSLYLMQDLQNEYDSNALSLRAQDPAYMVGYCPKYFSKDFTEILEQKRFNKEVCVTVVRNNSDAPTQFRLLCKFVSPWPQDFNPCADENYQQLVEMPS